MNINATSELSQKEYFNKLSPSFFKWLQECLLCFDLTIAEQIMSNNEYFRNFIGMISVNDHMQDLTELIGFTSSTEILKESFKIIDESFRVRNLIAGIPSYRLNRIFWICYFK
jgi:hypothetical protein